MASHGIAHDHTWYHVKKLIREDEDEEIFAVHSIVPKTEAKMNVTKGFRYAIM